MLGILDSEWIFRKLLFYMGKLILGARVGGRPLAAASIGVGEGFASLRAHAALGMGNFLGGGWAIAFYWDSVWPEVGSVFWGYGFGARFERRRDVREGGYRRRPPSPQNPLPHQ